MEAGDAPPLRVLVIDDDPSHAEATAEIVRRAGFSPLVTFQGEKGIEILRGGGVDIVVTDLVMRDRTGLDVVAVATEELPPAERPGVVVVTGYGSEDAAPAALRAGAASYLTKPLGVEMFRTVLDRLARDVRTRRGAPGAGRETGGGIFAGMVGRSPAMARVFDLVRRVSNSNATVLIEGESGTGKELIARALHRGSQRRSGPFVAVNCAALSAGLLESELFGHERGAFTGALASRVGRFEAAHKGTLFLDEIGEMAPPLQAKLLRALEEREVVRVGSNRPIPVDVRLIAAANQPLKQRVTEGAFRMDLFYRLCVVRVSLPPLRERAGDIPPLAAHLLRELAAEHGRDVPALSDEVLRRLVAGQWKGNVRELRNCLETLLLTCAGPEIEEADLPPELREGAQAPAGSGLTMRSISDVERELIENTLRDLGGNRARAAAALGISPRTLYRRIKELGLS